MAITGQQVMVLKHTISILSPIQLQDELADPGAWTCTHVCKMPKALRLLTTSLVQERLLELENSNA